MSNARAYTYDAETTFINFETLKDDDLQNVDSWFDLKASIENVPPAENVATGLCCKIDFEKSNLPQAIVSPMVKSSENHKMEGEMGQPKQNIVGSLAAWRVQSENASAPALSGASQRTRSKRLSSQQKNAQQRQQQARIRERCPVPSTKEEDPPTKKQKIFNRVPGKAVPACMARSSREKLTGNDLCSEVPLNRERSPARPKGKLTMPETPTILKRKNLSRKPKSTEEQELEKTKQLQQEIMVLRKRNEEFLKVSIAGLGQPVKAATGQVTQPVDFHFCSDERIKQRTESQPVNEYKELDFAAALRKHPPSPARVAKGPTIPKPFHLSQGNKRKFEETVSEYVPLAQQIVNFQKRTPSRYHLRSRRTDESPCPVKSLKSKLTQPKTPLLQTNQRCRPVTCKSAAELEAEEVEKIQQYKFKARELNPRILEGGPILPNKPPVKEPTQPVGFDLEIEKRIQERESKKQQQEEHFEFRSRPCPAKILEDVVGVPEKKPLPITVPKSPAFALKNRVRMPTKEEKGEEVVPVIKANIMPHYGVPFKPKAPEQRHVEVCPFSFDSRDRERWLQKEKKIEELQKEEMPKFKALPLPHFDHINLPEKKVKNPTQPEPFHLQTDERGATKLQNWQHQVEEDLKRQKEAACFKANPNTVVHQEPFVPKKDVKPISVPERFELATEKRAKDRQEFEKHLAKLETERERLQKKAQQQEAEQEKKELAKLRQELVHKANPVRKYRSQDTKPSDRPLTMPKSPNFSDRFRC